MLPHQNDRVEFVAARFCLTACRKLYFSFNFLIQFQRFVRSGALFEIKNYTSFAAIVALSVVFPVVSFIIEIIAAKGIPEFIVSYFKILQLLGLFDDHINFIGSTCLPGSHDLVFAVGYSFRGVLHDVLYRYLP